MPADQIARREAWEEIGLPVDDAALPSPFRIEHLCDLPFSIARTEVVVRPCIAMLYVDPMSPSLATGTEAPTVETNLIPRLDPREVAAVFTAPFYNFLRTDDEVAAAGDLVPAKGGSDTGADDRGDSGRAHALGLGKGGPLPDGMWYEGFWTQWHQRRWRMHNFYVPVHDRRVRRPYARPRDASSLAGEELENGPVGRQKREGEHAMEKETGRFRIWGMTARILVDAARIAYAEEPQFEHSTDIGDEGMIEELEKMGRLGSTSSRLETAVETEAVFGNKSKM